LRALTHNEHIRGMSQSASPEAPESFAVRSDSAPTGDILPTVLRTVHLAGHEWFDVSYRLMAKERREPTAGAAVMISRILDLMYIQMLRLWATSRSHDGPATDPTPPSTGRSPGTTAARRGSGGTNTSPADQRGPGAALRNSAFVRCPDPRAALA
jgi:Cupin